MGIGTSANHVPIMLWHQEALTAKLSIYLDKNPGLGLIGKFSLRLFSL